MADILHAQSPFSGRLPVTAGPFKAVEMTPGAVMSVAPYRGQQAAVTKALSHHGLRFPDAGEAVEAAHAAALWTGLDECFVISDAPLPLNLDGLAAVTDQTDGWGWLRLTGAGWQEVMARLCPVDPALMVPGRALRSEVGHMMAIVYGVTDGVIVGVMRSFAGTMAHDISVALTSVAAQKEM